MRQRAASKRCAAARTCTPVYDMLAFGPLPADQVSHTLQWKSPCHAAGTRAVYPHPRVERPVL